MTAGAADVHVLEMSAAGLWRIKVKVGASQAVKQSYTTSN
jgi:hypothetical protein